MFQFSRFASMTYVFSQRYTRRCGFPHSEICGSKLVCQLPAAYRRLQRPSSPVFAKASTMCTYSLDPITMEAIEPEYLRLCRSKSLLRTFELYVCNHNPYIQHTVAHSIAAVTMMLNTHYLLCFFQIVKDQTAVE
jgi:hypothetical protein